MSLILEALRKSEAERRRGQAPDLRTELPPVAPPRAHALPRWGWAVLAVPLLGLAWLLLARPGAAPGGEPLATPAETPAATDPGADTPREPASAPPTPTIMVDPPAGAPPQESAAAPRQEPAPAAHIPQPANAGASGSVPAASADDSTASYTSQRPPQPSAPAPPATAAPDERLLALSELSADERRQLPPLKLSMHMWSEDPGRRFVILDGQRLVEGDRAGPAVVDAIRNDDVVLAWNGMRIRLSLR